MKRKRLRLLAVEKMPYSDQYMVQMGIPHCPQRSYYRLLRTTFTIPESDAN